MKKIFLMLAISGIAVMASATDFYVAESFDNTNNKFNTISAAIAAASDGDRIYIQDKPGAGYVEDLNIDKSVSLINMNNNEKFTVTGNIPLPSSTMHLNLVGIELNGKITTSEMQYNVHDFRTLNILNSIVSDSIIIQIDKYNITFANSILNGCVALTYCDSANITGCVLNGNLLSMYLKKFDLIGCILSGNMFIKMVDNSTVSNSLIQKGNSADIFDFVSGKIIIMCINSTYLFQNNTFIGDGTMINSYHSSDSKILLSSNTFYNERTSVPIAVDKTTNTSIVISNNVSNSSRTSYLKSDDDSSIQLSEYNNLININLNYDPVTYKTTGDNINAGDPDPLMSDLDLTRNDAGCHGGPNSISNYFPQEDNGARVYKIEMPRRFFTGSNVNIKAYGVDK
jgi:hypothetical protein